jgi:isocitrate lyase
MRPHGRQGAGADGRCKLIAAPRRRCARRPDLLLARAPTRAATSSLDVDENDKPFLAASVLGLLQDAQGFDQDFRAGSPTQHADLVWCETSTPGTRLRAPFRRGRAEGAPRQDARHNCSPSFNWKKNLDDATIAKFQRSWAMGYKFQFMRSPASTP